MTWFDIMKLADTSSFGVHGKSQKYNKPKNKPDASGFPLFDSLGSITPSIWVVWQSDNAAWDIFKEVLEKYFEFKKEKASWKHTTNFGRSTFATTGIPDFIDAGGFKSRFNIIEDMAMALWELGNSSPNKRDVRYEVYNKILEYVDKNSYKTDCSHFVQSKYAYNKYWHLLNNLHKPITKDKETGKWRKVARGDLFDAETPDKRYLKYMVSSRSRYGLQDDLNYAISLLEKHEKIQNATSFKNLVSHIEGDKDCGSLTRKLINRTFDSSRMQFDESNFNSNLGSKYISNYMKDTFNFTFLRTTQNHLKRDIDWAIVLFDSTHPNKKPAQRDDIWKKPSLHAAYKEHETRAILFAPIRTRLLLVYFFYHTCAGNITLKEFKEWAK
jgi:hypothetical protein